MPFTSMDQHYHNTIMVSKIYLMMRIIAYFYGDVFFLNKPFNLGFKRNRHGGFRLQCLLDFLTLKVALNQVSHYFVFLVHLLGMLLHIIKHAVIKHNF